MATEQINKYIFQIIIDEKGVTRKIGDVEVSVKKFDRELKKATQSTKEFNTELSGRDKLIGNSGLASATLTELGRTISDLPYGIRGIANNLSQLSTLFITLQGKLDGSVKGFARLQKTVAVLINELRGPLGIILAFQAVIAIMDAVAQGKINLGKKTDDLTKKIKEETEALREEVAAQEANITILSETLGFYNKLNEGVIGLGGNIQQLISDEELLLLSREKLIKAGVKEADLLTNQDIALEERMAMQKEFVKLLELQVGVKSAEANITEFLAKGDIKSAKNQSVFLTGQLKALEIQKERVKQIGEENKEIQGFTANTIAAIEAEIKVLKKLRDETATTGKEYDSFTLKIKELQDELNELQGVQEREEIKSVNAFKKREEEKETTLKEAFLKRLRQRNFENDLDEENHKKDLKRIEDRTAAQERLFSFINQQAGQFAQIQSQAFDAQVDRLNTERDIILNNDNLTAQEKDKLLKENDKKTRDIRIKQIKFERDMFQLEAAMELAKLALSGKTLLAGVIGTGAKQTAEATGSISRFLTDLGPIAGPLAYGAMIGGVIAQIVTARKKAEQQIRALSGPLAGVSSGGGGSAPIAPPAFNVVGATQTSQLAQTISQAEQQPLRAYVVASDISTAQELERSTIEGASIG